MAIITVNKADAAVESKDKGLWQVSVSKMESGLVAHDERAKARQDQTRQK